MPDNCNTTDNCANVVPGSIPNPSEVCNACLLNLPTNTKIRMLGTSANPRGQCYEYLEGTGFVVSDSEGEFATNKPCVDLHNANTNVLGTDGQPVTGTDGNPLTDNPVFPFIVVQDAAGCLVVLAGPNDGITRFVASDGNGGHTFKTSYEDGLLIRCDKIEDRTTIFLMGFEGDDECDTGDTLKKIVRWKPGAAGIVVADALGEATLVKCTDVDEANVPDHVLGCYNGVIGFYPPSTLTPADITMWYQGATVESALPNTATIQAALEAAYPPANQKFGDKAEVQWSLELDENVDFISASGIGVRTFHSYKTYIWKFEMAVDLLSWDFISLYDNRP